MLNLSISVGNEGSNFFFNIKLFFTKNKNVFNYLLNLRKLTLLNCLQLLKDFNLLIKNKEIPLQK